MSKIVAVAQSRGKGRFCSPRTLDLRNKGTAAYGYSEHREVACLIIVTFIFGVAYGFVSSLSWRFSFLELPYPGLEVRYRRCVVVTELVLTNDFRCACSQERSEPTFHAGFDLVMLEAHPEVVCDLIREDGYQEHLGHGTAEGSEDIRPLRCAVESQRSWPRHAFS